MRGWEECVLGRREEAGEAASCPYWRITGHDTGREGGERES